MIILYRCKAFHVSKPLFSVQSDMAPLLCSRLHISTVLALCRFCDKTPTETFLSASSHMMVHFNSNSAVAKKGFHARVSSEPLIGKFLWKTGEKSQPCYWDSINKLFRGCKSSSDKHVQLSDIDSRIQTFAWWREVPQTAWCRLHLCTLFRFCSFQPARVACVIRKIHTNSTQAKYIMM